MKKLHNAIATIMQTMHVERSDIKNIKILKTGMTNRSFLFTCYGNNYIMRVPGEGTEDLINRYEETVVYEAISEAGLSDDVIYINPYNGYKITKYLPNARVCNPYSTDDLTKCMRKLKEFHDKKFQVPHTFDFYERINYYESLWNKKSKYSDYEKTKDHLFRLRSYIEQQPIKPCLCHIDSVCDNFLFYREEDDEEDLRLIDWEYAAMQDPHVDIAMFCIYALYDRTQIDTLIDIYFNNQCDSNIRKKIYAYIALCGLTWSNWCEYKEQLGVSFGDYALKQYEYAKEYYSLFLEM